jgi:hypothetical protein
LLIQDQVGEEPAEAPLKDKRASSHLGTRRVLAHQPPICDP